LQKSAHPYAFMVHLLIAPGLTSCQAFVAMLLTRLSYPAMLLHINLRC